MREFALSGPNWGVRKRVVSKRVVLADVPWSPKTGKRVQKRNDGPQKPEQGYIRQTTQNYKTALNCFLSTIEGQMGVRDFALPGPNSNHRLQNTTIYRPMVLALGVHYPSLENETSTGVLANSSRELANLKPRISRILSENQLNSKRKLAEFKRNLARFDQLFPGNRRN